mmetsp:Transcript_24613/g.55601  ORF Transcript_24613/g.55601 Transcript_24613/m.55601 type:complete len:244 (-) Transcript_24613:134-865(-)
MKFERVYPLDVNFSNPDEIPDHVRSSRRYADVEDYDIKSCAERVKKEVGGVDILVHAVANAPQVHKPLLDTSREGYLAAVSASSYSWVSMVRHFGELMRPGGSCLALSFIASERVIPGYGGGMSSAKAQLESDTRVLAYEAGRRFGIRVNAISAGPLLSRAASAIENKDGESFINAYIDFHEKHSPLQRRMDADDVGRAALALCSDLSTAITGVCLHVDNGMHCMGFADGEKRSSSPDDALPV